MALLGLMIAAVSIAAGDACLFAGAAPAEAATFRFADADGFEDHAAVRVSGAWAQSEQDIAAARGQVEFVLDTPWAPRESFFDMPARFGFSYESPLVRRERLTRGWQEAGYTFVERGGTCRPVLASELALAERARAMEEALLKPAAAPAAAAAGAPADAPAPSWLALWGPHLMVGAVALTLMGVVAKAAFFPE